MRTQEVKIQKYVDSEAEGRPILFKGTLNEVKEKILALHKKLILKGGFTKEQITWTENRTKDKKLGLGLNLMADNLHSDISYGVFWLVNLDKPIHLK